MAGLLLLAAALAGCEEGADQAAAQAQPEVSPTVTVAPVVRREVEESLSFVGRVEAVDEVELRARIPGFLRERAFVEGQDVEVGDLLFRIEPEPYEAAVALAEANLESARARIPETARALERAEQLLSRGNISEASVDEARAAALQAEAAVRAREAELQQARINLSYTEIAAPIDGRMGRSAFTVGNLIGPDSGVLAELIALDPIYVTFAVSEGDVIEFRRQRLAGTSPAVADVVLELSLPDGSSYEETGGIDFIDSRVDPATGTVPVRGVFPNNDRLLQPGAFVTVGVGTTTPTIAMTVPQAAVQQDQGGRFVLVVGEDNQVETRRIETGSKQGTDWVVQSGLDEGDMVIVEGLQRIRPGVAVNPVPTAATAEG